MACVISHDPEVAAKQLRRAAELGLKGAEINIAKMSSPMYQKDWDVLWAVAGECDMPISLSTLLGIPTRTPEGESASDYAVDL